MKTTLSPQELEGEVLLLCAELLGTGPPGWLPIPDPLVRCARCGGFTGCAGIFVDTSGYAAKSDLFCGWCIETYTQGIGFGPDDLRQVVADLALEQFEDMMEGGRVEAERLLTEVGA